MVIMITRDQTFASCLVSFSWIGYLRLGVTSANCASTCKRIGYAHGGGLSSEPLNDGWPLIMFFHTEETCYSAAQAPALQCPEDAVAFHRSKITANASGEVYAC